MVYDKARSKLPAGFIRAIESTRGNSTDEWAFWQFRQRSLWQRLKIALHVILRGY